jgi:hypothetical protein
LAVELERLGVMLSNAKRLKKRPDAGASSHIRARKSKRETFTGE